MNDSAGAPALARLGLEDGQVVQEFGWDEDVDDQLRDDVEEIVGSHLEDEEFDGVVDVVLLWWRDDDGDLIDACVDALTGLAEKGFVLLVVPGAGDAAHVDASDIQEAAQTAGLKASSSTKAGDWIATKLVQGGTAKQR